MKRTSRDYYIGDSELADTGLLHAVILGSNSAHRIWRFNIKREKAGVLLMQFKPRYYFEGLKVGNINSYIRVEEKLCSHSNVKKPSNSETAASRNMVLDANCILYLEENINYRVELIAESNSTFSLPLNNSMLPRLPIVTILEL